MVPERVSPLAIALEHLVDGAEVLEEGFREGEEVGEVRHAHHLTDRVHAELRHADVHCADASVGRDDRTSV